MADNFFKISKGATLTPQPSEPAGQNGDIYYNSALSKFRRYENGNWKNMGGEGSGFKNILTEENSKFESGISTWVTYNDAAAIPVDGTGGTATALSIATTTSGAEILEALASLKISKSASNAQGQGTSVASMTIDRADRGKAFFVYMSVDATHANYLPGDLKLYAYDVTNSRLLTVVNNNNNGDIPKAKGRVDGVIYTEDTTAQVRLMLHVASTNALAYDIILDEVVMTPQANVVGPIITPWQDYTLTIGGTNGAPTQGAGAFKSARWRRVGSDMEIQYTYHHTVAGAAGTNTLYLYPLPAGYTIDTTKVRIPPTLPTNTTLGIGGTLLGYGSHADTAAADTSYSNPMRVFAYNSSNLYLVSESGITTGGASYPHSSNNGTNFSDTNLMVTFSAKIPIAGWDNSTVMSQNDAGLQTINLDVRISGTVGAAGVFNTSNGTISVIQDNYQIFNPTTGIATIPRTGTYTINLSGATFTTQVARSTSVNLAGSSISQGPTPASFGVNDSSVTRRFQKGDEITFRLFDAGGTLTTPFTASITSQPDFNVFGVQGPIVVGATTDWQSYTPTTGGTTGFGTISAAAGRWRRVGDSVQVQAQVTVGTVASALAAITLPDGLQFDPAKLTISNNTTAAIGVTVGTWATNIISATGGWLITAPGTSTSQVYFGPHLGNGVNHLLPTTAISTQVANTGNVMMVEFTVPVVGWSSETRLYPTQRVIGTTYLKDVKASGNSGGSATSGSYQTRTLNTQEGDTGFCALASNQFTLQPGTYEIEAGAMAYRVGGHKIKIRNITDSTDAILGNNVFTGATDDSGGNSNSMLYGRINITTAKVFELQHRVGASQATNGYGVANSFGDSEVFSIIKIDKIY